MHDDDKTLCSGRVPMMSRGRAAASGTERTQSEAEERKERKKGKSVSLIIGVKVKGGERKEGGQRVERTQMLRRSMTVQCSGLILYHRMSQQDFSEICY